MSKIEFNLFRASLEWVIRKVLDDNLFGIKFNITLGKAIILMGVSGCGKSSVGTVLEAKLGWKFYDGDDFHPQANFDKMANGTPLEDADRIPWLQNLHDLIRERNQQGESVIVACSALKQVYRQVLRAQNPDLIFVHLDGDYDLILQRMQARENHRTIEKPV